MRELIQAENPGTYCLPGESEIKAEISALFAKEKEQRKGKTIKTKMKPKIPEDYREQLLHLLEANNWDIAPLAVLQLLEAARKLENGGRLPNDYPDKENLRSVVSSLKSTNKIRLETARKRSLIG